VPRIRPDTLPGRGIRVRPAAGAPAPPPTPPALRSATSGTTTGTSATVALPAGWQASDYLTLIVSTNQAPTLGFSAGVASSTVLANAGSRLQALRVVPNPGATSVTLTSTVSAVLTWWCGAWQHVDAAQTKAAANNIGNSTTAAVEVPVVDLGYLSTGYETYVSAAGVNSTATWGTSPTPLHATTSGNAALAVRSGTVAAGLLARASATPFDRGSEASSRNESALCLVLQPVQTRVANRLTNGSFESGAAAVATGWELEGTAPHPFIASRSASGVVDGAVSQRLQFTGTGGDTGNVAFYQASIPAVAGETVRATVWLSGTLTNAYAIVGIEGFVSVGGAYISEHDTVIDAGALTGSPVLYSVDYTVPVNATALAVYLQIPTVAPTTVADIYLDKAVLLAV